MARLSLKLIAASTLSASLDWVHRLRERVFSTLKTFSLLTVINQRREEPILFLRARYSHYAVLGAHAWEKIEDRIQTQENVSAPEYLSIYPVSKGGQEQVPEQSIGMGQVSSSTHWSPTRASSAGPLPGPPTLIGQGCVLLQGSAPAPLEHPDPFSHCCWSHSIGHVFQPACPHPLLPMLQSLSTSDKQDISLWPSACPRHAGSSLLLKTSSGSR